MATSSGSGRKDGCFTHFICKRHPHSTFLVHLYFLYVCKLQKLELCFSTTYCKFEMGRLARVTCGMEFIFQLKYQTVFHVIFCTNFKKNHLICAWKTWSVGAAYFTDYYKWWVFRRLGKYNPTMHTSTHTDTHTDSLANTERAIKTLHITIQWSNN